MCKSSTERTEIYRCVKTCVLYPGIGSSEMMVSGSIHYGVLSYIFFCQATGKKLFSEYSKSYWPKRTWTA